MEMKPLGGHTTAPGYIPHIDGLRALAVLSVLAYHLNPAWLPGGFIGVDVFFVISGFVVNASIDRLPQVGARASLLRFYARRLRRIAPALLACLLLTGLASALFIPESWLSDTNEKTGSMAFFGLSNWVLAGTGNDYFSPKSEFNPYTHTWSLGVEEQFYLLCPLLLLAWGKGGKARWVSSALLASLSLASLVHAIAWLRQDGQAIESFYSTASRFWQLGAGMLLYQGMVLAGTFVMPAPPSTARIGFSWRSPLIVLSLGAIGYGLWMARPGHSPWPDGLWAVAGTTGLLALFQGQAQGWAKRLLSLPAVVAIGRASYSLYLWHWPVFVLFRWTIGLESIASQLAALVLVSVLAFASYRYVEQPLRRGAFRAWSNARFVMAGLAAIVLAAGMHGVLARTQQYTSLSVVSRHPLDWYPYGKGLERDYPQCELKSGKATVPGGIARVFERGACQGKPGDRRQLFVAGDSHALAYNEMLRRFAVESGATVRLYGTGGCAVVGLQAWQAGNPGCQAYERNSLADVSAKARRGDVLFLPALRVPRLSDQSELFDQRQMLIEVHGEQARAARVAAEATALELLRPLADRGVSIVFEAPKPVLPAPPYRCSDWFNRGNPICVHGMVTSRAFMEEYRAPALESLRRIAAQLPHASVWDPLPVLCNERDCPPTLGGKPLLFDGDHVSGYANRLLLADFAGHLERVADIGGDAD